MNSVSLSYEDGIARITLQKAPVNVLDITMMGELEQLINEKAVQSQARLVVIQATGKAFSAGVDVADHSPERVEEMLNIFHSVINKIRDIPVPTVAAVNGAALGGGAELAGACDLILASEKAKFGQPEILLGVFPPVAIIDLPKSIGLRKATELIFTGQIIKANEALSLGLINRVFPVEEFTSHVDEFLSNISKLSRTALLETKAALKESLTIIDPKKALEAMECRYLERLMKTNDAKEGISAFMEKRNPEWKHC